MNLYRKKAMNRELSGKKNKRLNMEQAHIQHTKTEKGRERAGERKTIRQKQIDRESMEQKPEKKFRCGL